MHAYGRFLALFSSALMSWAVMPAASAQPAQPAPPAGSSPQAATPGEAATDAPEVIEAYERGFAALQRHDWTTAAMVLEDVAARSVDPGRRAAARELARYARVEAEAAARMAAGPPGAQVGPAAGQAVPAEESSGRARFVVSTTMASFYSGFVLDDLLGIGEYETSAVIVTGSALAGFAASLYGTRDREISEGMASSYGTGLTIGLGNGLLLAPVLGIDVEPECTQFDCDDGEVNQIYLGFGLGTMAMAGAAGALLGQRYQPTAPQTQYISLMGFNGIATTGLLLATLDADFDETSSYLALLGLGLDLGVGVGLATHRGIHWSSARVTYVSLAEFLGGLAGFTTAALINDDDSSDNESLYAGMVLAGMWGGFGAASYFTRDMRPHSRFAGKQPVPTVTVAPLSFGGHGRGLGLAGTF